MGLRKFVIVAVLVFAVGFTARLAYEQTIPPAYAEHGSPPQGLDCESYRSQAEAQQALRDDPSDPNVLDEDHDGIACETFDYPAGTPRDEERVPLPRDGRDPDPPPIRRQPPTGGPMFDVFPLMDSGNCPTPLVKRDGACYPR